MITVAEFLAWLQEQPGRRKWNLMSRGPIEEFQYETGRGGGALDPDLEKLRLALAREAQMHFPLSYAWIYRGGIMRLFQEVRREPRTIR